MSLLTAAERRRRNAIRRVVMAGGAMLAAAAVGVAVTLVVIDGGELHSPAESRRISVPAHQPTSAHADAGTWQLRSLSAGPLLLPRPTGNQQGIPTGVPHTTEGAISAAARYNEIIIGLDSEVAARVGEVAAAPSYLDAPQDLIQGVTVARRALGLHVDEPAPGAYLMFRAVAYRVLDATPDRVVVAVLGHVDAAGPATNGQGRSVVSAAAYTMVWAEGAWRIAADADLRPLRPLPQPRTPEAYENGWRDLALA